MGANEMEFKKAKLPKGKRRFDLIGTGRRGAIHITRGEPVSQHSIPIPPIIPFNINPVCLVLRENGESNIKAENIQDIRMVPPEIIKVPPIQLKLLGRKITDA